MNGKRPQDAHPWRRFTERKTSEQERLGD